MRTFLFVALCLLLFSGCAQKPDNDSALRFLGMNQDSVKSELGPPESEEVSKTNSDVTEWKYRAKGVGLSFASGRVISVVLYGGGQGYDLQHWGRFEGKLPWQLSFSMNVEQLKEAVGKPTQVLSEHSYLWKKDDVLTAATYDSEGRMQSLSFTR